MRPITRLAARRILWFAVPAAVLVFAAAFFPSISQRVPRFASPALATVGAALLVFSCVNSLVQFVRRHVVQAFAIDAASGVTGEKGASAFSP